MPRLFTAIDLPATVNAELASLCFGLPGAKWVAPEQLHLTLRFIGEVDGGAFREIEEVLSEVRGKPFAMQLAGLGCFPPRRPPRVLWVGIDRETEPAVAALYRRVESALVRPGLVEPEARKFSPHITLARLQQTPAARLGRFLAGNNLYRSEPFPVTSFALYSSLLTSKGAIHQLEAEYPLTP